jgi:hypothetical protein
MPVVAERKRADREILVEPTHGTTELTGRPSVR